jgi:hypothetical protein
MGAEGRKQPRRARLFGPWWAVWMLAAIQSQICLAAVLGLLGAMAVVYWRG